MGRGRTPHERMTQQGRKLGGNCTLEGLKKTGLRKRKTKLGGPVGGRNWCRSLVQYRLETKGRDVSHFKHYSIIGQRVLFHSPKKVLVQEGLKEAADPEVIGVAGEKNSRQGRNGWKTQ